MNQPKISFLLAVFFVLILSLTDSTAQTPTNDQSEPSFDIILQTIVASNDAPGKSGIAPPLSNIVKKLKNDFPFSNYRLTSTSIQRISNKGNAESRSVSYSQERKLAVFSEWVIGGLQAYQGQDALQIGSFRFGQRVPIVSQNGAINYEQVGMTTRFSLLKNLPAVIGSLTTTNADELMFLILTVKPTEK